MRGEPNSSSARPSLFTRLREHELTSRVASAFGLALLALGATAWGGAAFAVFWAAASVFFLAEFLVMVAYKPLVVGIAVGGLGLAGSALILLQPGALPVGLAVIGLAGLVMAACAAGSAARYLSVAGLVYAACVALPVILIRSQPLHGLAATLWLYAVVWATDIGAYFVGRSLGGPKLWPRISPKKTWSGLVGGTLIGVGAASLANLCWPVLPLSAGAVAGISSLASLAAHAGDLMESALKRRYSIKDSSQLIPGHGGFMDRLDGFAAASIVIALALRIAV
ncbi:phosphatidate cytidylyltransferase [Rhizobiales bacterium GAS191]|nr:phosphatidate cytidylyltransferase [Rhizobiales bacterium GAS113]SED63844.1 phosphatidate cytidylyltransferase [Rhizobiales bacterium GAS191]SEE75769.1 phosphatidate cytidylyltransferase [Rhizobiales bacterium GAS188]